MAEYKMKPIIFSTPMVQAILRDMYPKTNTRRVMKPQPSRGKGGLWWWKEQTFDGGLGMSKSTIEKYAPYKPGDVLWVRETWSPVHVLPKRYLYKADAENGGEGDGLPIRWRPSIHMPREAARLFLRVKGVRVERLQNISAEDCEAEGHFETAPVEPRPRSWFSEVWDSLNAKRGYGWDTNPWVWVYEFKRIAKEEVECEKDQD